MFLTWSYSLNFVALIYLWIHSTTGPRYMASKLLSGWMNFWMIPQLERGQSWVCSWWCVAHFQPGSFLFTGWAIPVNIPWIPFSLMCVAEMFTFDVSSLVLFISFVGIIINSKGGFKWQFQIDKVEETELHAKDEWMWREGQKGGLWHWFNIIQVSSQFCLHASVTGVAPQIILLLSINWKRCFDWLLQRTQLWELLISIIR